MKDPCLYLLPWLEDTDVTTRSFIFSTITITVVAYVLSLSTVSIAVCIASIYSERFRALDDVDKFYWCAIGTKFFFYPIPIFTGLWYLLVDDTLKNDVANGTTKTAFIAIYIHVGFHILDSILAAVGKLLYGNRFSTSLFIHHFIVLIVFGVITYYNGKGQYLAMLALTEVATGPLAYINWMLAKAKLGHLTILKVNQRINVYLWHFRTILEFYFFYTLIKNWSHVWNEIPLPLLIISSLGASLFAFGLTPQWTKVEAKRLYRQYSRRISFYMKPQQEKNKTL